MRRLGPTPLSGAEKQRRHREKVKARLAEAERLKQQLSGGSAGALAGLLDFYQAVLVEAGASQEERAALGENLDALQAQVGELVRRRAGEALEELRARRRKARSSLLARLTPAKPERDVD